MSCNIYSVVLCQLNSLFQALDLYELQFGNEPDPLANSNLKKLTTELDDQIVGKWNQREYIPAYRYLLIRSLLTKVHCNVHRVLYVTSCHTCVCSSGASLERVGVCYTVLWLSSSMQYIFVMC